MAVIGLCATGTTSKGDVESFRQTPAGGLVKFLEKFGHQVVDYTEPSITHFVSLDHHKKTLALVAERIPVENRVLVVQEPLVVQPANYSRRVQSRYGAIVSLTPATGDETLPWPQANWPVMNLDTDNREPNSIILVNANKSSFLSGSRYGLRRRVMQAFLRQGISFDLAGSGWDRRGIPQIKQNLIGMAFALVNGYVPRLSEYSFATKNHRLLQKHGIVESKYELMARKDFAVVIENSQTYISEKLFDAVIAGCIPLFCGPSLSRFGIPEGVAVELPNRPGAFVDAYRSLTQQEKDLIREKGQLWLNSPVTISTWSQEPALERLAQEISSKIS